MLCPKCGYITFDKLSDCPKCKKSWANITENIIGTSFTVERHCFLGRVLKNNPHSEAPPQEELPSVEDSEVNEVPVVAGEEENDVGLEELSDADSLDVALDELPDIDFSAAENEEVVETKETENIIETEAPVSDAEEVKEEIDFSFDVDDSPAAAPPPPPAEKEVANGAPTVNLNDIDLSGLVTEEDEAPVDPESELIGLDLAALENEEIDLEMTGLGEAPDSSGLSGIDLSLYDDEDGTLELSLDLESSELETEKKKNEPVIPDLGLSLDLDD